MLADIGPGVPRARERRRRRARCRMTMLRCGRRDRRLRAARGLRQPGPDQRARASSARTCSSRYRVELRDSYEGIDERDLDRVVLDLPEPWQVVPHAEKALRPGGILVAYTPSIMQAAQIREALAGRGWIGRPHARGAAPRLARRGPGRAPRPPHGRPHRLPDRRPASSALTPDATRAARGPRSSLGGRSFTAR